VRNRAQPGFLALNQLPSFIYQRRPAAEMEKRVALFPLCFVDQMSQQIVLNTIAELRRVGNQVHDPEDQTWPKAIHIASILAREAR
jgi:Fe-S oxidoreductase